jgi:drug/metabolite transporter (DMT)-like permease
VGLGTVGVLTLLAAVSLAVIVFFRRNTGDDRPWNAVIAPALVLAGLLAAIYLSVHNFDALTGVTSGPVTLLPWLIPLAALIGFGVWYLKRAPLTVTYRTGRRKTSAGTAARPGSQPSISAHVRATRWSWSAE